MADTTAPIDLSAGLVPNAAPANTPATQAIDLSAGLVPNSQVPPTASDASPLEDAFNNKTPEAVQAHPYVAGFGRGVSDFVDPLRNLVSHPVDAVLNVVKSTPGVSGIDPMIKSVGSFNAYENARSSGASVTDSLKAASQHIQKQDAAHQAIEQRIAEYKKNPGPEALRALTDAAGVAATLYLGSGLAGVEPEAAAADMRVFDPKSLTLSPAAEADPIGAAVSNAASKSGLTEGTQKALGDILRPNTTGKIIGSGGKTNFLKSFRDFDALSPEEQAARFGADAGPARSYLKGQARNQIIQKWGWRAGLGLIAHEAGVDRMVLHAILD